MQWKNTETPTFAGSAGSGRAPTIVEQFDLVDRDGNVVATFSRSVTGVITLNVAGAISQSGVTLASAFVYKGVIDCSTNPNWPAASAGDVYKVSVAGKIGGASGQTVQVGDVLTCSAAASAGTDAQVGTSWFIEQGNIVSTADVPASTNKNYVTDAQLTVIANTSGANTGDQTLPVKASGAEVNTATDDAKFVTAKALADSNRASAHPWELRSSNFTAVVGHRYQVDCSGGVVTMTLPIAIAVGDEFVVEDATLSWATNNLTIAKAASGFGDHINGGTTNYTADVAGGKLSLVGISAGQGVSIK